MIVGGKRSTIILLLVAALLALVPFGLPRFYTYLTALIVTMGLLSTSLNFALGYGGIYQLHHGVFYGTGAYATAVMITKLGYSPWLAYIVGPLVSAALKSAGVT